MAAMRAGVKTVIIPAENEPDLEEIDQTVRSALNFITTNAIDDILDIALDFSKAEKNSEFEIRNSELSEGSADNGRPKSISRRVGHGDSDPPIKH